MSAHALQSALDQVPFVRSLGARVEESVPGRVRIALPHRPDLGAHGGGVHTAVLFALGELAATVSAATHPDLANLKYYLKASRITYLNAASSNIRALAILPEDAVDGVRDSLQKSGRARLELRVDLHDERGNPVGELISLFLFRVD